MQQAHEPLQHITIKPSKQWVLPPRPRPGRKPNGDTEKKEKKTYKKKQQQQNNQQNQINLLNNEDSQVIESALRSIKDENKLLKQELSKLVFDLKQLQAKQQEQKEQHLQQLQSKKRNHLEMEREDSLMSSSSSSPNFEDNILVRHSTYSSEDDEISSQISSAPSLMSSTSSLGSLGSHSLLLSNSLSSLSSIKEEEANALKIDEFLTTSYFDNSSNYNSISNDKHQTNVDRLILKEKLIDNNQFNLKTPPSLPIKSENDDFEFNFLKNEKLHVHTSQEIKLEDVSHSESLFDSIKIEDDVFGTDWDWK